MILKDDYSEKVQYDNPDYPFIVRRCLLSSYPNYAAPSHWHNDIEFIAVLSMEKEFLFAKMKEYLLIPARCISDFQNKKKNVNFSAFFFILYCSALHQPRSVILSFPSSITIPCRFCIFTEILTGRTQFFCSAKSYMK